VGATKSIEEERSRAWGAPKLFGGVREKKPSEPNQPFLHSLNANLFPNRQRESI